MLRQCLEQAVTERLIPYNPANGCRLPKKEKKKMKLWKKIVIGIVIVLVILLIAAYFIIRNMFSQPDIEAAKGRDHCRNRQGRDYGQP